MVVLWLPGHTSDAGVMIREQRPGKNLWRYVVFGTKPQVISALYGALFLNVFVTPAFPGLHVIGKQQSTRSHLPRSKFTT